MILYKVIIYLWLWASSIKSISIEDENMFSVYRELHQQNNNLVFMSYGNDQYHQDVVQSIIKNIFQNQPLIECVNVHESKEMEKLFRIFHKQNKGKKRLFIVHNLEKLTDLIRNNYIFSVKDPTAYSKIIILLTWDQSSHNITIDSNNDLTPNRQILIALEKNIHSDEVYVNGAAAVARIDDVFYDKRLLVDEEMTDERNLHFCSSFMTNKVKPTVINNTLHPLSRRSYQSDHYLFPKIQKYFLDSFYPKVITGIAVLSAIVYYVVLSYFRSLSHIHEEEYKNIDNKPNHYPTKKPSCDHPSSSPSSLPHSSSKWEEKSRDHGHNMDYDEGSTCNSDTDSLRDGHSKDELQNNREDYKFSSPLSHKLSEKGSESRKKKHRMVTRSKEKPAHSVK